jgi:ACS family hexuronate transporter-like MFS transporter
VVGALFTLLVGWLVDKFSYYPAFFLAATVPMLATISVLLLIRPVQVESRPLSVLSNQ